MTFKRLAEYFERLEETASRLSLIDILSELFSEVKADEVPMVSYLIQGRVAPFYEPVEIGMAEKNVASSIARAYGVEREEVLKEYGRLGDLGKVAQKLNQTAKSKNGGYSVETILITLKEIAGFSGDGTV